MGEPASDDGAAPGRLTIQLLGGVRAWAGDVELPLGSSQQRAVAALLALDAGRPVSSERLIEELWGADKPASAANVLQTYVKRLRQVLEPKRPPRAASTVLPSVGDGYCLRVDADAVDVLRIRNATAEAAEARRRDDHRRVRDLLVEPLRQLTAPALAGVPVLAGGEAVREIEEARWTAIGWDADAALALGDMIDVLPALEQAATALPFDEAFHARLVRAYRLVGRRADAITAYQGIRRHLADDLGVDPGPELIAAYQELLDRPADAPVPFDLPARVGHFTGRAEELEGLAGAGADVQVQVVTGPGGIGKTALMLEWAYRVRQRFPDGQLYLDLRGHDPATRLPTVAILQHLLRAMGVRSHEIPSDQAGLLALYRNLLANGGFLILLDNAADAEQVELLVPESALSTLAVTSRQLLTALTTRYAVHEIILGELPADDAVALLGRTVGADRVARERDEAVQLVQLCGRYPLALRIVAAQLASRKRQRLADFVRDMSNDRARLGRLAIGDGSYSVRAAFAGTYASLSAPAARVFHALGTCELATFTPAMVAAAAGTGLGEATKALYELHAAHLVNEVSADRYGWHDLISLYAQECAREERALPARPDTVTRFLEWYLFVASVAGECLAVFPYRVTTPPAPPEWCLPFESEAADINDFLDAERSNLVRVARCALEHDRPDVVWKLCLLLVSYFAKGHGSEGVVLGGLGMRAALMVDDPVVQGFMRSFMGRARLAEGRHADGLRLLSEGLDLQTGQSDTRALAIAYKDLALGHLELREFHEAIDLFQTSAALFEELGEFRLVACLINNVADAYNFLDKPEVARAYLRRVMALLREHPHPRDEACALSTLGETYLREGDPEALDHLERALALHRRFGDRRLEAVTLTIIAQALRLRGDHARALACLDQAMRIHQSFANRHDESRALQEMAEVHLARDDHEEARRCLLRAVAIRRQVPYPYLELGIHRSLAEIAATTGRGAEEKYHRAQVRRLTPLVSGKPVAV